MLRYRLLLVRVAVSLGFGLGVAGGAQAQPQSGVACVLQNIPADVLSTWKDQSQADTIDIEQVATGLEPMIMVCIEAGQITTQEQVGASFTYTLSVIGMMALGETLQAAGVDPAAIEAAWRRAPAQLQRAVEMNELDRSNPFPRDEMIAYLGPNTLADEAGLLGTALYFVSELVRAEQAEQAFVGATGN